MTDRFVVIGVAPARSVWFRNVARWSNDGSIGIEFVKCVSTTEVRAHLRSNRAFSAVLVDAAVPGVDRDLIDEATSSGVAVLVVDDLGHRRDWRSLGASAVLAATMSRDELTEAVRRHARPARRIDTLPGDHTVHQAATACDVTAVCGTGGSGASTVAMAAAQVAAENPAHGGRVLLVDCARRAELAMLHDAGDVVPGLPELVERLRGGPATPEEVNSLTFAVPARRYDLLLGLRRPHQWATVRLRALDAAFAALTSGWRAVVCDCDGDIETEAIGGSADVEHRTALSRKALSAARRILVVGTPEMKGMYSLAQLLIELSENGVSTTRLVPVVNHAPRAPHQRAQLAGTLHTLVGRELPLALAGPLFVPEHRRLEAVIRDVASLPAPILDPLRSLARLPAGAPIDDEPIPVVPGELGHWVETV